MNAGIGEAWLINITNVLRSKLPSPKYIISHAPQAPYFMGAPQYRNGGYLTVDKEVGDKIDFYNIQFYNQGTSSYDSYETLFEKSNGWAIGTSIKEIAKRGVNINKIVVGKPVTQADVVNSGYVPVQSLKQYLQSGIQNSAWKGGIMGWQYADDIQSKWINTLATAF